VSHRENYKVVRVAFRVSFWR